MKTLEQRVQVIEDREAIAALQARYINLNDGGWDGPTHCFPEAVGELFVEDGVWAGPETAGRAEGPAAIVALFREFVAVLFIVYYVTNPLIEVDGDTAASQWHAIIASAMPGGDALLSLGCYDNQYLRTASGWKYRTPNFLAIANSPYELGWGKQFVGREMSFR